MPNNSVTIAGGERIEFIVREDWTAVMAPVTLSLERLKASIPPTSKSLSNAEIEQAIVANALERAGKNEAFGK